MSVAYIWCVSNGIIKKGTAFFSEFQEWSLKRRNNNFLKSKVEEITKVKISSTLYNRTLLSSVIGAPFQQMESIRVSPNTDYFLKKGFIESKDVNPFEREEKFRDNFQKEEIK